MAFQRVSTLSLLGGADNVSVGDSSSLVMVDKWSETEGEQNLDMENDTDLDAYLQVRKAGARLYMVLPAAEC